MRRSKRVAKQSVVEGEEADEELAKTTAAKGPKKATGPAEAGPDTEDGLPEEDLNSEDEHPSDGEEAQEDTEGHLELDDFEEGVRAAVDALQDAVAEPAAFLRPSSTISELARHAAKALYATALGNGGQSSTALPELYTEGLDAEQIWLQLDMQLGGALKRARRLLRKTGDTEQLIHPAMEAVLDDLERGDSEGDTSGSEDGDDELLAEEDGVMPEALEDDMRDRDDDGDGAEDMGQWEEEAGAGFHGEGLKPTEDRFMRLDDMERFVCAAEEREMEDADEEMTGDDSEDEEQGVQIRQDRAQPDLDSEDEAALDNLLEEARRQSGSRGEKRVRFEEEDDDGKDEDDSREAEDIHYKDFFDPVEQAAGAAASLGASGAPDADDEDDGGEDEGDEDGQEVAEEPQDAFLGEASVPMSAAQEARNLSSHERRMQRMAERARKLEAQNVGEKEWFMRGEAASGARPLNSALEVDLDFERAVRPPQQPTEEVTASIEDLIRKRIADHNFDDVPRIAPPAPEKRRKTFELSDQKSSKLALSKSGTARKEMAMQGLGEIYEEDFVQATAAATGTALDDKEEKIRAEARMLTRELFAKLDALSHFQYAPKPVIEDLSVKADVPALAMEEVAPQIVSEAAMRLPEEVYRADGKGAPRAEGELTHEERRRRRAQHKRDFKAKSQQQVDEKASRAVTQGGDAALPGRKSMAADVAAADAAKAHKRMQKKARKDGVPAHAGKDSRKKSKYSSSSAFFGQLQDQRDAAAKGVLIGPNQSTGASSKALKL